MTDIETKDTAKREPYYCAFCAKRDDAVLVLIAGPTGFICNECVELCAVIVAEHRGRAHIAKLPTLTTPDTTTE